MRVFISYHTPDRAVALTLKAALESARPGLEIFVDKTGLRAGHLWQPALFNALKESQAFVILVSHHIGDWQKLEYYEALDRKAKDDDFVLLPVIIGDRAKGPVANLPALGQHHFIESTEPTAPDKLAEIVAALTSEPLPPTPELWRTTNPYRGLLALDEQDADYFFGRDADASEVLHRLISSPGRLITLVGNSGVGKSSLVRAGVVGFLKRQRWPSTAAAWPTELSDTRAWAYLSMQPGENPLGELVAAFEGLWQLDATDAHRLEKRNQWIAALATGTLGLTDLLDATRQRFRAELAMAPPPRLLLYIDQAEELFARGAEKESRRFAEIIAAGLRQNAGHLIVMTSLRADYFAYLEESQSLLPLVERINIEPLGVDALKLVLREPARTLGVGFESETLVDQVAAAAVDQPGALPLLADLFTDLWERMRERGDGVLRVLDRSEVIQVGAPLTRRANQFLITHPDKIEAVKRLLTLRLAHVSRHGEPVRRRLSREVVGEEEWGLAQLLAEPQWRLLVTSEQDGRASAEVAHEVLLKAWPTLRQWLEQERDFLVWRDDVEARRREFDHSRGRQRREALLMGLPLAIAQQWLRARGADIEPPIRHYIAESHRAHQRRRRGWRLATAAAFVALSLLTLVSAWQWQRADRAEELAARQRDEALLTQSGLLANVALERMGAKDYGTALLAALEALPDAAAGNPRPYVPEAEWLANQARRSLNERLILSGHREAVLEATFSPDGRRIVTASSERAGRLWDARSGREIAVLAAHTGSVLSAIFSADGHRIATASFDNTARIWDGETGRPVTVMRGHARAVIRVAFSPDRSRLATASFDGTARVWDVESGRQLHVLAPHGDTVTSLAFSSDGRRLVTAASDHKIRLWNVDTGSQDRAPLEGHRRSVHSVAFSPDDSKLVSASSDDTARIWDVASGALLRELKGHDGALVGASFSPDGRRVVTFATDNTARIWPLADPSAATVLKGHGATVRAAGFSPDGRQLVTAAEDATARIWDVATGEQTALLTGHEGTVRAASFSPDGKTVVTASTDQTARVWDAERRSDEVHLLGHADSVNSAVFSPDGRRVLTSSADRSAMLWEATTGKLIGGLQGHEQDVVGAAFSPDGTSIVTSSADGTARLWDAGNLSLRKTLSGHTRSVLGAAFSADSRRIVTSSADNTARIWDAGTGEGLASLVGHDGSVRSASFSPDGRLIVTASADNTARLWDARTGAGIGILKEHEGTVLSAGFSPDGRYLATASIDHRVIVWNTERRAPVARLVGHEGSVVMAVFSPDGKRLVTAAFDNTARIWDAESGRSLAVLRGHANWVLSAAFSPDGRRVATTSSDYAIRIWDAASGKPTAHVKAHDAAVNGAAFSPDGQRVLTASSDKSARVWLFLPTQALVDDAKRRIPRCLTPEQRARQFLPLEPPDWCIEMEKWPYRGAEWKGWLAARRAGQRPPLPGQSEAR